MEQPISERVSTLETEVAVIQSNYVRRDELALLREEMRVGFARVEASIEALRSELNAKIDAKIDAALAGVDAKIERACSNVLKWVFASQVSVAAMYLAAIKYL